MSRPQYEADKAILAGAPDDGMATHVEGQFYLKYETYWYIWDKEWVKCNLNIQCYDNIRALSDIETMCERYERIEALEEELWRTEQDSEKTVSRAAEIIEKKDKRIAGLEKDVACGQIHGVDGFVKFCKQDPRLSGLDKLQIHAMAIAFKQALKEQDK